MSVPEDFCLCRLISASHGFPLSKCAKLDKHGVSTLLRLSVSTLLCLRQDDQLGDEDDAATPLAIACSHGHDKVGVCVCIYDTRACLYMHLYMYVPCLYDAWYCLFRLAVLFLLSVTPFAD